MIIYTGKDYYDVSRKAANIMSAQIIQGQPLILQVVVAHNGVVNVFIDAEC